MPAVPRTDGKSKEFQRVSLLDVTRSCVKIARHVGVGCVRQSILTTLIITLLVHLDVSRGCGRV
mgnify:CR=1 FL=1